MNRKRIPTKLMGVVLSLALLSSLMVGVVPAFAAPGDQEATSVIVTMPQTEGGLVFVAVIGVVIVALVVVFRRKIWSLVLMVASAPRASPKENSDADSVSTAVSIGTGHQDGRSLTTAWPSTTARLHAAQASAV